MTEKILGRITPYIGVVLFLAALIIVRQELKLHTITEIITDLSQLPLWIIVLGIILTGVNYFFLTGYDFLALCYLGRAVSPKHVVPASLISFAVSNNTGQALISGSSMRYRFYSGQGLSGLDILKFSLFLSLMYVLGATTLLYQHGHIPPDQGFIIARGPHGSDARMGFCRRTHRLLVHCSYQKKALYFKGHGNISSRPRPFPGPDRGCHDRPHFKRRGPLSIAAGPCPYLFSCFSFCVCGSPDFRTV